MDLAALRPLPLGGSRTWPDLVRDGALLGFFVAMACSISVSQALLAALCVLVVVWPAWPARQAEAAAAPWSDLASLRAHPLTRPWTERRRSVDLAAPRPLPIGRSRAWPSLVRDGALLGFFVAMACSISASQGLLALLCVLLLRRGARPGTARRREARPPRPGATSPRCAGTP